MHQTRNVFHRFLVCLALCLAVTGCAKPSVRVDTLSASAGGALPDVRYAILPGMPEIRNDDLSFLEYQKQLASMLRDLGCAVTEDGNQATGAVLLSWQASEKIAYYEDSGPTVGIGAGSSSYDGPGWGGGSFLGLGIGIPMGDGQAVMRYRYMVVLDAVAVSPGNGTSKPKSLWKVTLSSESDADSLRTVMPAMLEAAKPYIGKTTPGPVSVTLD